MQKHVVRRHRERASVFAVGPRSAKTFAVLVRHHIDTCSLLSLMADHLPVTLPLDEKTLGTVSGNGYIKGPFQLLIFPLI